MLEVLSIHNLALIDRVELHLADGLNVLTGETGAGKSMVIDALSLILGGRASSDMVRSTADKAVVEAAFSVNDRAPLHLHLSNLGMEASEQLVISREVTRSGRSLARINGRLTTVAALKELGELLVDIHGQHEHQSLLKASMQRDALDAFGGKPLARAKDEFNACYRHWQDVICRFRHVTGDDRERAREVDLLRYEIEELEAAQLEPDEDENLAQEEARLTHAVQLTELVEEALDHLYTGNRQQAATAAIGAVSDALTEASQFDATLEETLRLVEEIGYQLEDAVDRVRQYRDSLTFDPDELRQVQERLDILSKLKRKYGANCAEMIEYAERARCRLHELENASALAEQLASEVEEAKMGAVKAGHELRTLRHEAVKHFEHGITSVLPNLGMADARFLVKISPTTSGEEVALPQGQAARLGAHGMDDVTFLISTNPGEPMRPLARVASGGELSRIMLALRSVIAVADDVPTLVFDEVDAGVGGMVSQAVAEELANVATSRQVLCVTHLATIAAHAQSHLVVTKHADNERTVTTVRRLEGAERPPELARMLGVEYAGTGAKHAKELFMEAQNKLCK